MWGTVYVHFWSWSFLVLASFLSAEVKSAFDKSDFTSMMPQMSSTGKNFAKLLSIIGWTCESCINKSHCVETLFLLVIINPSEIL